MCKNKQSFCATNLNHSWGSNVSDNSIYTRRPVDGPVRMDNDNRGRLPPEVMLARAVLERALEDLHPETSRWVHGGSSYLLNTMDARSFLDGSPEVRYWCRIARLSYKTLYDHLVATGELV